jgi:uncharacterized protein (TIGR02145 family)
MKRSVSAIIAVLICIITVYGQAPASFKYQTVVRNPQGDIIANQQVNISTAIIQGSPTGPAVCDESFAVTTNQFGLVNLQIGSQDPTEFENIDWSDGPFYLQVSLNGTIMGTSELLSVPYAFYANKSGSVLWNKQGNDIYYDQGSVSIGSGSIHNSAALEVQSMSKGFLPPRMTYNEIKEISNPANGLIVFCTDCDVEDEIGALTIYIYGTWFKILTEAIEPPPPPPCETPLPPTQGLHDASETIITWQWNHSDNAIGYKWNDIGDYNTAIDLGTDTIMLESSLDCSTQYTRYIWAYSGYSEECVSDSTILEQTTAECTPCTGTVEYEGHTYNTVLIGDQCWLKENLDIGEQINGLADPTDNGIVEKYCFGDDISNCEIYGGLYQFHEAMNYKTNDIQGVCPDGWHVPTDKEWCTVSTYLDNTVSCYSIYFSGINVGIKMKASTGWDSGNGTNESGFTALPGGVRFIDYYDGAGWASDIWTSTTQSPGAIYHVFGYNQDGIGRYVSDFSSHHGFAVRCIRD